MASRLSYECLCGDLSQSVASWRDVPMLLMTMQRLVAMRARDLLSCLVTHCSGLSNSCASATECRRGVVALSQSILAMIRCVQEAVSRESRLFRTGHAASTRRFDFEPPPTRPSEASVSSGSPSCTATKGQRTRNSQGAGQSSFQSAWGAAAQDAPNAPPDSRTARATGPWLPC